MYMYLACKHVSLKAECGTVKMHCRVPQFSIGWIVESVQISNKFAEYGTCTCILILLPRIVRYGRLQVVKYLVEVLGCSTGCTDSRGQTPLHVACE